MKRFKFAAIAMVFTSMVNAQQELPLLEQAPFTQQELDQPPAAVLDKIEPMFQRQAKSIRYFTAPFDMIAVGVVSNDYKKNTNPNHLHMKIQPVITTTLFIDNSRSSLKLFP